MRKAALLLRVDIVYIHKVVLFPRECTLGFTRMNLKYFCAIFLRFLSRSSTFT